MAYKPGGGLPKYRNTQKYKAEITEKDGIKFDSKKEARRYSELLILQKAGQISRLRVHPEFPLLETFEDIYTGETERGIKYIGDFLYVDHIEPARLVCEDTKGFETTEFRIKWKWVKSKYPGIEFRIV